MAATGFSRIVENRRFEDYRSMKQSYQHFHTKEYIISGHGNSSIAGELQFSSEDTDYVGAAAQACIRCEADDANQHGKYVYLTYQNASGVILGPVTADLDGADSTTEVNIGAADCYRVREMYSEIESATAGGKMITLTDAAMAAGDNWAYIDDGNSQFAAQRYFVPSATPVSYTHLTLPTTPYV